MIKVAIPLLRVSNSAAPAELYCNRLGFRRECAHRADDEEPDPLSHGSLTRRSLDACIRIFGRRWRRWVFKFLVDDADALYTEFVGKGQSIFRL